MSQSSDAGQMDLSMLREEVRHIPWMVLFLPALLCSLWITLGADLVNVLQDDYFYYHVIARNYLDGLGTSFFPGLLTNGYQPLWQFVIIGSLQISDWLGFNALTTSHLVSVIVGYAGGLWVCRYAMGRSNIALLLLPSLMASIFYFANMGMEAVAVLLAYALYADTLRHPGRGWMTAAILLFACFMARIDSIIYIGLITLYAYRQHRYELAKVLSGFTVLGLCYAAVNHFVYGVPVPISGLAKNAEALRIHWVTFSTMAGSHSNQLIILLVILASLGMHLYRPGIWRLHLLSWVGIVVFYFMHALRSDYGVWGWYLYPYALHLVTLATFGADESAGAPSAVFNGVSRLRMLRACQVLGVVGFAAMVGWHVHLHVFVKKDNALVQAGRYVAEVARQSGAKVIAMGDRAGVVAYLSSVPLVQLEGLVMDKAFLDKLVKKKPLGDVLRDYNVDLYIATVPHRLDSRPGCHAVLEPMQALDRRMVHEVCYPISGTFKADSGPDTVIFNVKLPRVPKG